MKHRSIPKQKEGCFGDLRFWTPVVYFYIINRIGSIEICLAGLRKFYYPHFRNGMIRTEKNSGRRPLPVLPIARLNRGIGLKSWRRGLLTQSLSM